MKQEKFKGFHDLDVYLYTDENKFIVRRKTWYFYLIPIWVKQYKIK
jgi:hypothetical protein